MTKQELYQAQQAVVNDRKNGVTNNTLANKVQSDANYDPYQGLAAYTPGNGGGQAQAAAQPTYSAPAESSGGWDGGASDYASQIQSVYAAQLAAQQAARKAAYDSQVTQQNNLYNQNAGKVNSAADKSLQEAYINRMLSQKNLGQQMAAQGLNGGATESTIAGMENNYGNSRNNIETGRNDNLADLATTLQNNLAQAYSAYQNGGAADYAQYTTDLTKLIANNAPTMASVTQSSGSNGNSTMLAALQQLLGQGVSTEDALQQLGGSNNAYLTSYLNALQRYQ